jgi:hypothetical protein
VEYRLDGPVFSGLRGSLQRRREAPNAGQARRPTRQIRGQRRLAVIEEQGRSALLQDLSWENLGSARSRGSATCGSRLRSQPLGEKARRSAEFLGEPYEKSFGPADVAEPIRVFVLDHFAADKLRAVLTEPGERLVDVVHGEHHA